MGNIRIITDSASDMPVDYREDVTVVPLHVRFGTEEYLDGVNLSHREFYEKLIENEELPTTSQVAPYAFEDVYEKARQGGAGYSDNHFRQALRDIPECVHCRF